MTMLFPVLNGWFDNDFNDNFFNNVLSHVNTTAPAVNVKEDNDKYTMEVAVPGIKKEYVRIDLNKDGDLELAIENKLEHKEEDSNKEEHKEHYLRREFSYSNYQQTYSLPEDVDKEGISAKVEDGILTITLPKYKKEVVKNGRSIEIG